MLMEASEVYELIIFPDAGVFSRVKWKNENNEEAPAFSPASQQSSAAFFLQIHKKETILHKVHGKQMKSLKKGKKFW